jgi:hypothetical protein
MGPDTHPRARYSHLRMSRQRHAPLRDPSGSLGWHQARSPRPRVRRYRPVGNAMKRGTPHRRPLLPQRTGRAELPREAPHTRVATDPGLGCPMGRTPAARQEQASDDRCGRDTVPTITGTRTECPAPARDAPSCSLSTASRSGGAGRVPLHERCERGDRLRARIIALAIVATQGRRPASTRRVLLGESDRQPHVDAGGRGGDDGAVFRRRGRPRSR